MIKTEISTTIRESGWKQSQIVEVMKSIPKLKHLADKRRVSHCINSVRTDPLMQETIAKIITMDAELLFGDKYWKYVLGEDTDKCPVCGKSEKD